MLAFVIINTNGITCWIYGFVYYIVYKNMSSILYVKWKCVVFNKDFIFLLAETPKKKLGMRKKISYS